MAVGVGLRGLAGSSSCSVAFEASCMVRDPSDQRRILALDCSREGFRGERLQRMVLMAVEYGEKVDDGGPVEWWSVTGGWKSSCR